LSGLKKEQSAMSSQSTSTSEPRSAPDTASASNASACRQDNPEVHAYVQTIVETAAAIRMPELFTSRHPAALYYLSNRNGVSVVALRTTDLTEPQLMRILTYRLAQYLVTEFVEPHMAHDTGLQHEPRAHVSPDDVHVIVGNSQTGELLCYLSIELLGHDIPAEATLCDRDRSPIGLETSFGADVFNRLRVLPDLPLGRVREIGRFMKNQTLANRDELSVSAPIETLVACVHLLTGPLRTDIDAIVGSAEKAVVLENLAFMQLPVVVIHGAIPYADQHVYMYAAHRLHDHFPFAFLVSDMRRIGSRVAAIEQALELPGAQAIDALRELKHTASKSTSALQPAGGLADLNRVVLPQRRADMATRRSLLDRGAWLRTIDLFRDLSLGEATVVGTLLERREVAAGEVLARHAHPGDGLYLIEGGVLERSLRMGAGRSVPTATLGPGSYVGEVALTATYRINYWGIRSTSELASHRIV
jgi:hypothetical protein